MQKNEGTMQKVIDFAIQKNVSLIQDAIIKIQKEIEKMKALY